MDGSNKGNKLAEAGREAVTDIQGGVAESIQDAEQRTSNLTGQIEAYDQQLRAFISERPFVAVAGALVVGYVVANFLSRVRT